MHHASQLLDPKWLLQMLPGVLQGGLDTVGFRCQLQHLRMLRLATGAPLLHHQPMRYGTGDVCAQIFFHHA
ncbi:hypothetical protein D3C80_2064540 [compost metagenome]